MSLMSMRRKMASKQTITIILWVLIAVFLVGIVLWNVPRNSKTASGRSHFRSGPNKVIVTINGQPIYADAFDQAFDEMYTKAESRVDLTGILEQRSSIYSDMLQDIVAGQVLRGFGVKNVSRQARELARDFAKSGLEQSRLMAQQQAEMMMQQAKTPEEKKKVQSAESLLDEQFHSFYAQYKVEPPRKITEVTFLKFYTKVLLDPQYGESQKFMSFVKNTLIGREVIKRYLPEDVFSEALAKKIATQKVNARWIFIAAGSKKDDKFFPEFTAEALRAAKEKAQQLHDEIAKDPAKFSGLAEKESRDVNSRGQGGSLGWVTGGAENRLPAMLEYLIFTQKPKELGPVTQFTMLGMNMAKPLAFEVGYGFVQVTAEPVERQDLGENYDWKKEKDDAIDMLRKRYEQMIGMGYLIYMVDKADVKFDSKEIARHHAWVHNQFTEASRLELEALKQKEDLPEPVKSALSYSVAASNPEVRGEDRIPLLETALQYAGDERSNLHYRLGEELEKAGRKDEAIEQFDNAVIAAGGNAMGMRRQVREIYQRMGYTKGIEEIDQWIKEQEELNKKEEP